VSERSSGDLTSDTEYGEVISSISERLDGEDDALFWTHLTRLNLKTDIVEQVSKL
jgi:hypothetical protein